MLRAVFLLGVAPFALVACGGAKKPVSSSSSLAALQAAALKTVQAGSEHVSLRSSANMSGQKIALSGTGAFDTTNRRGTLHVDLSADTLTAPIDEVLAGNDVYARSPLLFGALPGGKKWLKIDLAKGGKASGFDLGLLAAQNPGQALDFLRSLKNVTTIGTETIDGVSTTRYHAIAPGSTYDAWVGDDGYIHRVRVSTTGTKVSATTDLSDFGTSVHVAVPSAAESYATNSVPGLGG